MTINAGQLAILPMTYASAATVNLNVKSYLPCFTAGCSAVEVDSKAKKALNIINSQPMRDFPQPPVAAAVGTIAATKLFPFTDKAYGFWTGGCANQNPEKNGNTGYFNAARSALPGPGETLTKSVYQPPVNLRVMKDSAGVSLGQTTAPLPHPILVRLKYDDGAGCTATYDFSTSFKRTDTGQTSANNYGWPSLSTTAYDPGLPFGDYTLCVLDNSGTTKKGFYRSALYQNRTPTGNTSTLLLYNSTTNPFTTNNTTQTTFTTTGAWPAQCS
jgi:hypothetical protein